MENLFAYGTLMFEDIMQEVSGVSLTQESGVLKGYSRYAVKGEHYPALVPDGAGSVKGVIYRNVPESAWIRLDRFEGEMYARKPVQIVLEDETMLHAMTYVVQPMFLDRLEPSDWDYDAFLRNGKERFQQNYMGYRSL